MSQFAKQATRRVVSSSVPAHAQVLATVGLNDVDQKRVAALEPSLGTMVRLRTASELFRLIEDGSTPVAVLIRYDGGNAVTGFLEVLRHHQIGVPVYVVCGSRLEASYFGAQQHLGPVIGLTEPLDDTRLKSVEAASASAALGAQTVPAEGDVSETGLAALAIRIQARGASGVLHLTRGETTRRIYFSRGEPVYAESNLLAENFGRQLRARGVIGDVEYEWAQRVQAKEGIRQGEALVQIGALTKRGLYALLREQIRDKILNAFARGQTHYRFESARPGQAGATSRFELNLVEILVAGLWRTRARAEIDRAWARLSGHHVQVQRVGQPLWRAANQVLSTRFLQGVDDNRPVGELFGVEQPVRERLALLQILEMGRLGFVTERPAEGVYAGCLAERREVLREPSDERSEFADDVAETFLTLQGADHYGVLGVEPDATIDAVRSKFEALKARYEPARMTTPDSDLEFQLAAIHRRLDEAWAVLGNEDERSAYHEQWLRRGVGRTSKRSTSLDAEAAFRHGQDALRLQRVGDALDSFRAAQALNGGEPLYRLYEGWALVLGAAVATPQWVRGRQLIDRALGANPLMPDGYYFSAKLSLADGDPDGAVENLRMALRLDRDHRPARELLTELAVGEAANSDEPEVYIDLGDD